MESQLEGLCRVIRSAGASEDRGHWAAAPDLGSSALCLVSTLADRQSSGPSSARPPASRTPQSQGHLLEPDWSVPSSQLLSLFHFFWNTALPSSVPLNSSASLYPSRLSHSPRVTSHTVRLPQPLHTRLLPGSLPRTFTHGFPQSSGVETNSTHHNQPIPGLSVQIWSLKPQDQGTTWSIRCWRKVPEASWGP